MRVVLVSPGSFRKNVAGLEESVFYLGKELQKNGVEVEIFCTAQHPVGKTSYEGLPLTEFPRLAPGNAYYWSSELFSALAKGNHDIIHCYGYNNLCSLAGLIAKKPSQKYILTGASSISSSPIRKWLHIPLNILYTAFGKKIDKLICVSDYERVLMQKNIPLNAKKYCQIPNGINLSEWKKIPKKRTPQMILSVGRLVHQKGMHRLINALPIILQKYPNATLQIVGEGTERKKLNDLARKLNVEKSITFHGHIQLEDRKKLHDLYSKAHVFSLMANSESQGLVYAMALATKTNVVATNNSAMKDLVNAGAARGVENPDDAQEVARAIMDSFEKPFPKMDMDELVWSWERIGKEVFSVYQELLGITPSVKQGAPKKRIMS